MDNKIVVRTDIIDPHTYLDIELEYKDLIEVIFKCGGYALFQQIYKYYGNKSKGYREIRKMEDLIIVGSEQLNNNKYIYLKITALRYLKYRDCENIDEMIVNRLLPNPSFRPLMNSIYSFEYLLEVNELINTDVSIAKLTLFLEDVVNIFEKNRLQNIHLGKVVKDDYKEQLKMKLKILGDRNSIYLKDYTKENTLDNSILKFVWYDFDNDIAENPIMRVLALISRFLNNIGTKNMLNCCKFSLEIVTISEEKKSILKKLTKRALKNIDKTNKRHINNGVNINKNKVISNIFNISYRVLPDIHNYIKVSVKVDSELGFADIDTVERIENLKSISKRIVD